MILGLLVAVLAAPGALDEEQVVAALKQAERVGLEEHDQAGLLRHFAPDGRWVVGRRAAPDAHDVILDLGTMREILALDLAGIPNESRVDFAKVTPDLDADPPTVELIEVRKFHGGRSLVGVRFTLAPKGGGWQVVERRQWDIEERVGLIPTLYDDAYWLDADAVIDYPGTDSAKERLDALFAARRYAEVRTLARQLLGEAPNDATALSFLAQVEFRLGNLEAARDAARKARLAGGAPAVPEALMR